MEYVLVKDELGEANAEVVELERLLEEARARQSLIQTGQGTLTWKDKIILMIYKFLYSSSEADYTSLAETSLKDIDTNYMHARIESNRVNNGSNTVEL